MSPRPLLAMTLVCACGARTGLDTPRAEAGTPPTDAAVDATKDVMADSPPEVSSADAPAPCDYGTLVSDVFGSQVLWNGGAPVPAGHYRVTYVDGCMKYSTGQAWSVNAYANGPDTLFVVANGTEIAPAPGTVGFLQGQGGFSDFDACVSANVTTDAPLEFDFGGGTLGLELADDPYGDNVAGESGRNPTYRLSSCP